jgi:hypothetical protein
MACTLPTQNYTYLLDPKKGWPTPSPLDYSIGIDPLVLYSPVAGQVGHQDSTSNLWQPGVTGQQMGLFAFQGACDNDVSSAGNSIWQPIQPRGIVNFLVAKGPYQFQTTAFDTTQTYLAGQLLRAPVGLAANQAGISGYLTNQGVTLFTTACCGLVAAGVQTNAYGDTVLDFWPIYCPGTTGN